MTRFQSLLLAAAFAGVTAPLTADEASKISAAYEKAGLDEREAAAFLLDRLTYGARPGEVDRIVEQGLGAWLDTQLQGRLPDAALEQRLQGLDALGLNLDELTARFPSSAQVQSDMRRFHQGLIPERDVVVLDRGPMNAVIDAYTAERNMGSQDVELHEQLTAQKVLRAVYTENQLREVMTDFWLNHFFTTADSFDARIFILPYEAQALRPNALADFGTLLKAVSRHPGMRAFYSAHEQPSELAAADTTMAAAIRVKQSAASEWTLRPLVTEAQSEIVALDYERDLLQKREFWDETGPNLEYAHALLTQHTLGPDADVAAADVAAVARAFTGWTVMPMGASAGWFERGLDAALEFGFVSEGGFLFRADEHDARAKTILGERFPAGGGVEEGDRVLDLLAGRRDTARHVSHKLALRFVGSAPSARLVGELAGSFMASDGSIPAVLRTLLESPEFWQAADRRKVKTPLEYVASALRATNADVESTHALVDYVGRMGQPLYTYEDEAGVPDSDRYWLDSASLIHRINFANHLVEGLISDVTVAEPAQSGVGSAALTALMAQLMPGRELDSLASELLAVAADSAGAAEAPRTLTALIIASPEFQVR